MEDIIDIIVTETTNLIEITSQPTDEIIDVNIIDNREDIVLNVTPTVVEININSLIGNFGVNWGQIIGTLSNQTDLQNALNLKADLVGGKVPSSQLPSYVDDVIEVANFASLPATGETGKIYITLDTNFMYRWSGSTYIEIKDSSAVWGAITGTLSNQTDLQNALNSKEPLITSGTTSQYYRGDKTFQTLNTTAVTEGTNLYYLDTRARAAISGGTGISYNSSTGVITNTITQYTDALARGAISLTTTGANGSSTYNSTTGVLNIPSYTLSGLGGQPLAGNLTALAGLQFTNVGFIKMTGVGTLALDTSTYLTTSLAASTYVPYTGAISNVILGAYKLKANSVYVEGDATNGGGLRFKQYVVAPSNELGYNSISSQSSGHHFSSSQGDSFKNFLFDPSNLTDVTLRSYIMPNASGTIALTSNLSAYQPLLTNPVTGTGTSGIVAVFNGTSSITDSSIYANSTRVSIGADVTTSNKFTSVASTSSSYAVVAQASGAANGFWATLSGTGEIFRGQTSGGSYFIINNGGNAFLNGNLNIGDFASTSYRLNVVGTANITGALSGTSATFSGKVGIGAIPYASTTAIIRAVSATSTNFALIIEDNATNQLFEIKNSGAATFSSSVAATNLQINGVDSSGVKVFIDTAVNGLPATSGTSQSNGALRLRGGDNAVLDFGLNSTNTWIQATDRSSLGTYYNILLNPRGGNVGIGTPTPSTYGNLTVVMPNNSNGTGIVIKAINDGGTASQPALSFLNGSSATIAQIIADNGTGYLAFNTGSTSTERMRITNQGELFFGCTTQPGAGSATTGAAFGPSGFIIAQRNAGTVGFFGRGTNDGELFAFYRGATQVGSISVTTVMTSYNITSDYRLKEDLKPINGLDIVNKIKVYNYQWKADSSRMDGVLAHELAEVLPYAVTGIKDGEQMQSVDYSKIVPVMVQAIKDLKAKIETLENK